MTLNDLLRDPFAAGARPTGVRMSQIVTAKEIGFRRRGPALEKLLLLPDESRIHQRELQSLVLHVRLEQILVQRRVELPDMRSSDLVQIRAVLVPVRGEI